MEIGPSWASLLMIHLKILVARGSWGFLHAMLVVCYYHLYARKRGSDDIVFWDRFGERPPVYLPFSSSVVYSNIGWAVIGFVLKNVTGQDAGEYIKKTIWEPQGSKCVLSFRFVQLYHEFSFHFCNVQKCNSDASHHSD